MNIPPQSSSIDTKRILGPQVYEELSRIGIFGQRQVAKGNTEGSQRAAHSAPLSPNLSVPRSVESPESPESPKGTSPDFSELIKVLKGKIPQTAENKQRVGKAYMDRVESHYNYHKNRTPSADDTKLRAKSFKEVLQELNEANPDYENRGVFAKVADWFRELFTGSGSAKGIKLPVSWDFPVGASLTLDIPLMQAASTLSKFIAIEAKTNDESKRKELAVFLARVYDVKTLEKLLSPSKSEPQVHLKNLLTESIKSKQGICETLITQLKTKVEKKKDPEFLAEDSLKTNKQLFAEALDDLSKKFKCDFEKINEYLLNPQMKEGNIEEIRLSKLPELMSELGLKANQEVGRLHKFLENKRGAGQPGTPVLTQLTDQEMISIKEIIESMSENKPNEARERLELEKSIGETPNKGVMNEFFLLAKMGQLNIKNYQSFFENLAKVTDSPRLQSGTAVKALKEARIQLIFEKLVLMSNNQNSALKLDHDLILRQLDGLSADNLKENGQKIGDLLCAIIKNGSSDVSKTESIFAKLKAVGLSARDIFSIDPNAQTPLSEKIKDLAALRKVENEWFPGTSEANGLLTLLIQVQKPAPEVIVSQISAIKEKDPNYDFSLIKTVDGKTIVHALSDLLSDDRISLDEFDSIMESVAENINNIKGVDIESARKVASSRIEDQKKQATQQRLIRQEQAFQTDQAVAKVGVRQVNQAVQATAADSLDASKKAKIEKVLAFVVSIDGILAAKPNVDLSPILSEALTNEGIKDYSLLFEKNQADQFVLDLIKSKNSKLYEACLRSLEEESVNVNNKDMQILQVRLNNYLSRSQTESQAVAQEGFISKNKAQQPSSADATVSFKELNSAEISKVASDLRVRLSPNGPGYTDTTERFQQTILDILGSLKFNKFEWNNYGGLALKGAIEGFLSNNQKILDDKSKSWFSSKESKQAASKFREFSSRARSMMKK
jgi:hypothetical protein